MTSSETWFMRAAKLVVLAMLGVGPGCTVVTVGVTTNGNDEGDTEEGPGSATWGGEVGGGSGYVVTTSGPWEDSDGYGTSSSGPWEDSDGYGASSSGPWQDSEDDGGTTGGPYPGTTSTTSGSSETASSSGPWEDSSGGETSTTTSAGSSDSGSEGSGG